MGLLNAGAQINDPTERKAFVVQQARDLFLSLNAQLRSTAELLANQYPRFLGGQAADIARIEAEKAGNRQFKVVQSNKRLEWSAGAIVRRSTLSVAMFLMLIILLAPLLALVEQKTLSEILIASGLFSFSDYSLTSIILGMLYCLIPVAFALLKRSYYKSLETKDAKVSYARGLYRRASVFSIIWIVVVSLLFGPALLTGAGGLTDPFAQNASWVTAMEGLFGGLEKTLTAAAALFGLLMVLVQLLGATYLFASIFIYEEAASENARKEYQTPSEDTRAREDYALEKETDMRDSHLSYGPLSGLLTQIDGMAEAYAMRVLADCNHLAMLGDAARSVSIEASINTRRIDTTKTNSLPLFAANNL